MVTDLYAALGVETAAEAAQVRAAYLRLMRQHHPDLRPWDPVAQERARDLNAAFEVLGDPVKRAAYDRLRTPSRGTAAVTLVRAPASAYSEERASFRQSVSASVLRFAALLLALGVLLLTVAPQ